MNFSSNIRRILIRHQRPRNVLRVLIRPIFKTEPSCRRSYDMLRQSIQIEVHTSKFKDPKRYALFVHFAVERTLEKIKNQSSIFDE